MEMRDLETLKDHPLNYKLYDPPTEDELSELCRSIERSGMLQAINIKPDGTIISGHRRKLAALRLKLGKVPCIVVEPDDEELAIIEYNRYRRKSLFEIKREMDLLMVIESRRAADRVAFKTPAEGPTRDKVAKALGMSGFQLDRLKKIFAEAETNPNVAEKLRALNEGKTSVNAIFKAMNYVGAKEDLGGFDLQVYNLWYWTQLDMHLGQPHPGRIAGQVIQNILWYFTSPGDLVTDPFAGGGITIDACKQLGRHCLALDVAPQREDIAMWDITKGFPKFEFPYTNEQPQLIFADPPYWNMLESAYADLGGNQVSSLGMDEFSDMLFKFCRDSYEVLKPGGFLAIITMPQRYKLPEGVPFKDWPVECRLAMDAAGFVPYDRIVNRWPVSIWNAHQIEQAKNSKQLLQVTGDIIIGRKP